MAARKALPTAGADRYFTIERNIELREARDRLAERVAELERGLARAAAPNEEQARRIAELQRGLAEASQRNEERAEALRAVLAVTQEELRVWRDRSQRTLERAVELTSKLVAAEREAAGREAELARLNNELSRSQQEAQAEAQSARRVLGEQQESSRRLSESLSGREGELASLRDELAETRRAATLARREMETRQEELALLRRELARLGEEVHAARLHAAAASTCPPQALAGPPPSLPWERVFARLAERVAGAARDLSAAGRGPDSASPRLRAARGRLADAEDLARLLSLHESPVEVKAVPVGPSLHSALKPWSGPFRGRRIAVARRWEGARASCRAQPERLQAALYQVLLNAYEAMPRGGILTVEASLEAEEVVVAIGDSGGGFPPAALKRLFEPCAAARAGHLGVGLAVARSLARQMGGELAAENHKSGARVVLRLRRLDEAQR